MLQICGLGVLLLEGFWLSFRGWCAQRDGRQIDDGSRTDTFSLLCRRSVTHPEDKRERTRCPASPPPLLLSLVWYLWFMRGRILSVSDEDAGVL